MKPVAGDNILFDVNSAAHNCTFDLALALGSFTMTADYSGTITQAASFSVTEYSQAAGTFTGSTSYWLTDSGPFTSVLITPNLLKLKMIGNGNTISLSSTGVYLANLWIADNTTLTSTGTDAGNGSQGVYANVLLQVDSGKIFTIASGKVFRLNANPVTFLTNSGTIAGPGTLQFFFHLEDATASFGIVNAPVDVYHYTITTANRIFTVGAATTLGSTPTIRSGHASETMAIDLSASNYALSATDITIGTRGILNGRGSVITCNGTFDSSAGAFTQGTSTLIMGATGNLKCAADGGYNLRVAEGVTTTLTAALNVYKDLRNMGTLTRGANTVSLLGAGEQTVSGYPDTAITVNSTGPVIFHECAHHHADVTATAGTFIWTGYGRYVTHGNLSISAISRKPGPFDDVENLNGTLTFDAETRMKDLITDVGQTTVQSAGIQLGISGKISTAGTFTQNTPTKIVRTRDIADSIPFPVQFCVNQPKGWGDA